MPADLLGCRPPAEAGHRCPASVLDGNAGSHGAGQQTPWNTTWTNSNVWSAPAGVGSYRYPGVTDKSIYDWENVNILGTNFGHDKNTTYNVEVEQEILPSLNFSAGIFRQDFTSTTNYTVSQLNVATIFVDTNTKLPDGRTNPYFGLPFVEDFDPDQFINKENNETKRALLAWTPDFTRRDGWTRWLGRHQVLGLISSTKTDASFLRKRMYITASDQVEDGTILWQANPNNNPDGSPTGWNRNARSARRLYYLSSPGSPTDGRVTVGAPANESALVASGETQIWNFDTRSWNGLGLTQEFIDMTAAAGPTQSSQRKVDSQSLGVTSNLWNDRIVATLGWRKDDYRARASTTGIIKDAAGQQIAPAMTQAEQFVNGVYQTETIFNRFNRWDELSGSTKTLGGVVKPFKNWGTIDRQANDGSAWWQFVRSIGLTYNKSDNFNPPAAAQVDGFGTPLPKPTGEGRDFGFQFELLNNKLFARVNWFKATNENERTNPGTSISRLTNNVDTTLFRGYARTIALINMGFDPRDTNTFGVNLTPAQEQSVQDATAKIWGQPYNYYLDIGTIYATRSAAAEGMEVQVTYNPTPNWTMKFTAGKQETRYSNVLKEFDALFAARNSVWSAARGANFLLPQYQQFVTYTTNAGVQTNLTDFWNSYGYAGEIGLGDQFGLESAQLYYNGIVTPHTPLPAISMGRRLPASANTAGPS